MESRDLISRAVAADPNENTHKWMALICNEDAQVCVCVRVLLFCVCVFCCFVYACV